MARAWLIATLLILGTNVALAQSDAALLQKNLDAADAALRKDKYDDALLSIRAALAISPGNQRARVIEMDVYTKKGDEVSAMDAALKAFDASKVVDKNSPKNTTRVQKYIKQKCATLVVFLDLRSGVVDEVLKLRKRALKETLTADADWLAKAARLVYPTHAELENVAGAGEPRFHEIKVAPGMYDLLRNPDDWTYYNANNASGVKEGVLTLRQKESDIICDAGYKAAELKQDFKLSLRFQYKKLDGMDPNFSILFSNAADVLDVTSVHSIAIDPWGNNRVKFAFINPQGERGWKELAVAKLAAGTVPEGEWVSASVLWNSGERVLSLDIKGQRIADRTLDKAEELGHYLHFGVGSGMEVEIKDLFATVVQKPK